MHTDWSGERGLKWRANLGAMEAMLAPVDAPLLRALQVDTPAAVADVGCGGGDTARRLAEDAPAGSRVDGFDISAELIEAANHRRRAQNSSRLSYQVADVAVTLADAPYDRLTSRFGVMFFEDPPAAFANLTRWLKPDGRFAFAVWGALADNPWIREVYETVAQLIELPPPLPDTPGPFRYADPMAFVSLLETAGFAGLKAEAWRGELAVGGGVAAQDAARFALGSFGVAQPLQSQPTLLARAEQTLTTRYQACQREGVVRAFASVHIVSGGLPDATRPSQRTAPL